MPAEHMQPSDRMFWRKGNEGYPRRDKPRKRDKPPESNSDVFARFSIYPDLKNRIIIEKDKQNKSTSSFVRSVLAHYFDIEERERNRGKEELPLKHKTIVEDTPYKVVILRVYMSPSLKRKIIQAAQKEQMSMSMLVRQILHKYFFNLLMKGKK